VSEANKFLLGKQPVPTIPSPDQMGPGLTVSSPAAYNENGLERTVVSIREGQGQEGQ
jgi:hypothetical protein